MKNPRNIALIILAVAFFSLLIDLPAIPLKFNKGGIVLDTVVGGYTLDLFDGKFFRDLKIKKGLDLAGGVHIVLQADTSKLDPKDIASALESAKTIIEKRVNLFGVSEPNIQTSKVGEDWRIIVEMPGIYDTEKALSLIGTTAKLNFKQLKTGVSTETALISDFEETGLSGADLKRAYPSFDQQTNAPQVALEFTAEGGKKFAQLTKDNLQKPLGIFLDNSVVTAPTVQSVISDGRAVISGSFTLEETKNLSIQLNAGALPVSVKVVEQRNIGAALGNESVQKSLIAGVVGLSLVLIFMIGNYGRLGVIASLALVTYSLITLAVYKLIPVVLTLPGISGFILSIGMAVDSNILIFERIKEERREGKPLGLSMELGFGRAWDSIRDANVSTLITGFLLLNPFNWNFLVVSGPVRGFAVTLILGVLISLFTGIVVTRNLVRVLYKG